MPKSKLNTINVPKFYQHQLIDYVLYGMIKGMKLGDPNSSIEVCVFNTLEYLQLSDNFDPETVRSIYHKMDLQLLQNKGL